MLFLAEVLWREGLERDLIRLVLRVLAVLGDVVRYAVPLGRAPR